MITPLDVDQEIEITDVDGRPTRVTVLSIDYLDRTVTVIETSASAEEGPFSVPFEAVR